MPLQPKVIGYSVYVGYHSDELDIEFEHTLDELSHENVAWILETWEMDHADIVVVPFSVVRDEFGLDHELDGFLEVPVGDPVYRHICVACGHIDWWGERPRPSDTYLCDSCDEAHNPTPAPFLA